MTDLERGSLSISDDVIATYLSEAVLSTDGVYDLYAGFSDTLSKSFLGKDSIYRGLKIVKDDEGYEIDVYIIVCFGVKIPEIAWNVQKNSINRLESVMDIDIKNVNIHIQGVSLPKDESTPSDE